MTEARALVLAAAFWSACREARVTESDLEEAAAAWRLHDVTSYEIEVALSGRFERRVEVVVRGGAIVEGTVSEHGVVRALNEAQARPYTVDGLFRMLAGEARRGRGFVRVWFDETLGFPEHAELGPRREDEDVLVLRVERFETLPRGE